LREIGQTAAIAVAATSGAAAGAATLRGAAREYVLAKLGRAARIGRARIVVVALGCPGAGAFDATEYAIAEARRAS
jgi:hypothetical protein